MNRIGQLITTSCFALWQMTMPVSGVSAQQLQPSRIVNTLGESPYLIEENHAEAIETITDGDSVVPSNEVVKTKSYKFSGRYHLQQGTNQGYLILECELPPGNYINSLTQGGDLNPSEIRVTAADDFLVGNVFQPDVPPTVIEKDPVFAQRLEKHTGKVQFFIPIQIREGTDTNLLKPEMVFDGQVCSAAGVCMPIRELKVRAGFAGYFERSAEQQDDSSAAQNK